MDFFFRRTTRPLLAAGPAQLHGGANQPEHNPRHRHPPLARRRIQRIRPPRRCRPPAAASAARIPSSAIAPDDQRPRAAEAGADDDEVALEIHRRRRAHIGQEHHGEEVRVLSGRREQQSCRHGAQRRARQRHADEIGGEHHAGADQAADQRRDQHRTGVAHAEDRAGDQRAEDEAEDGQHDAEQAVAEEAGDDRRRQQHERRGKLIGRRQHQRSRRPSIARVIVTSSAYSRSDPTGNAHRDARHAHAERLEQPRQVERGRFALDGRIGREDHFVHAAVADARAGP